MTAPWTRLNRWWVAKREERKRRRRRDGCFNGWFEDCFDLDDCWSSRRGRSSGGCDTPDCDLPDCDGCGGCDLMLLTILIAALGYFRTAPVTEGRPLARPVLRLIRSYQQNVSAHRPAVCNLTPTCSAYGYSTLRENGLAGLPQVRRRLRECASAGRQNRATRD